MKKLFSLFAFAAIFSVADFVTSCGSDEPNSEPPQIPVFDPANACYSGAMESSFTMGMQDMTFPTMDCKWNVIIDKNNYNNTCVKLIDAKFAEMMPTVQLLLQGLTYDPINLTANGENIVAGMWEGDGYTPNPSYTFKDIKINFNDKLHSGINATFTVSLNFPNGGSGEGIGKFNSTGIIL